MRTLILAAGRFGSAARDEIRQGREPRLDVFELASKLCADVIDYLDADRSGLRRVRFIAQRLGPSAAVAYLGYCEQRHYDAVLTTGEDIGLPLALMLKASAGSIAHTMIAHTLSPAKKRVFFKLGVEDHIHRILVYSTSEEDNLVRRLGVSPKKIQRIYYHADQDFFRPDGTAVESDLVCAAGQLLRDYDTLIEAVRGLPMRLQIAAGSPWIERRLEPRAGLPPNVTWGKLSRWELRQLYAKSAIAVVPILQNDYQTGIATILEMMSMGKCVIATRTRGQTDTIVHGETGIYVSPGNPQELRDAIVRLSESPGEAARIGLAARRFVEENASLDRFVERLRDTVRSSFEARNAETDTAGRLDPKTARLP